MNHHSGSEENKNGLAMLTQKTNERGARIQIIRLSRTGCIIRVAQRKIKILAPV